MALFSRANLNTIPLLNHCYCKFTTGIVSLKTRGSISVSNFLQDEYHKPNASRKTQMTDDKNSKFQIEIANRRNQACRSILVQVSSSNSQDDLQTYCSQYGKISSMHHYRIDQDHNYILIEFHDAISVNDIMSTASFREEHLIAPLKTSVLSFHKGLSTPRYERKYNKINLSVENGCACPTDKQIGHLLKNAKTLSGQIIVLYNALQLNDLETRLRFHTAHHIEQYFSGLLGDIKVLPFGSSINGFGRKRCDLDLVLLPANIEEHNHSRLVFHTKSMKFSQRQEMKEFMRTLASNMQHFIPGIRNIQKILEARVPIIKFQYQYVKIECDLSTTNTTAIYMSELLWFYGEVDWRVRPLVMAVRKWAKNQDITSDIPGHWITNFPLSLLVLFYLQQKKILPSLKMLKSYAKPNDIRCTKESYIDCTFVRDVKRLPPEYKFSSNQDSLETLLFGFFEYYSTFDFYAMGICIREGIPIPKPSHSALHITNPFETALNVSKNVTINEVNRIIEKIHDAIYILETEGKPRDRNWGLGSLLNKKNSVTDTLNSKEKIIDDSSDYPDEISDKFEVDDNINQPKKKETIV